MGDGMYVDATALPRHDSVLVRTFTHSTVRDWVPYTGNQAPWDLYLANALSDTIGNMVSRQRRATPRTGCGCR